MIDSDYRYTQDAHQKDRSAILHGSGGQHPTAQPNQYATPLHITLHRAALEEKQQQPGLPFDPHQEMGRLGVVRKFMNFLGLIRCVDHWAAGLCWKG